MATKASVTLKGQHWHFVQNQALRNILERDYDELKKLLKVGAHKSAVVLSGSIVEAALVTKLQPRQAEAEARYHQRFPKSDRTFDRWELGEIVQIAADLDIVHDKTLAGQADAIRSYRNLIHPMVEYRKQARLDADTVDSAVSLLKSVLKNLADDTGIAERERFMQRLRVTCGEPAAAAGGAVINWAQQTGLQIRWTPALKFQPWLLYRRTPVHLIAFRTSGHINVAFKHLKDANTPFRFRQLRDELAQRLNEIPGLNIEPEDEVRYPAVHLKLLLNESARQQFLSTLTWAVEQIKQGQESR